MTIDYPPLIGFTGRAGAGKSTAAGWILRNHQALRLAFASPLKSMTRKLIEDAVPKKWHIAPTDYLNHPIHKNEPIPFLGNYTGRHLMQTLGTEWGRQTIHPDFWVGIAAAKVERMLGASFVKSDKSPIKIVFDDVRFENEAEMIRAYGGTIIRVTRPGEVDQAVADHASETDATTADTTLINDGTQEDLFAQLERLYPPTMPQKA